MPEATGKPIRLTTPGGPDGYGLGVAQQNSRQTGAIWVYEGQAFGARVMHLYLPRSGMIIALAVNSSTDNDDLGDLAGTDGTLGNWVNAWRQENPEPDQPLSPVERARVKELEDEVRRLPMENEFGKKQRPSSRGRTTVIDRATRMVTGWQLASHMRTSLVTDALFLKLLSRMINWWSSGHPGTWARAQPG